MFKNYKGVFGVKIKMLAMFIMWLGGMGCLVSKCKKDRNSYPPERGIKICESILALNIYMRKEVTYLLKLLDIKDLGIDF